MRFRTLTLFLLLAMAMAAANELDRISDYENSSKMIADMACDMVTTRAQAGSTRDVHDQIFSFLRSHSPDARAEVVISSGGREIGSRTSGDRVAQLIHTCKIENAGDYTITIATAKPEFFDLSLLKYFLVSLLGVIAIAQITQGLRWIGRKILLSRLFEASMQELGFTSHEKENSKFYLILAKTLLVPLEKLKPILRELRSDRDQKASELSKIQAALAQLDVEKLRADRFADTVEQVRHDLKGPLSALKIAASQKCQTERRNALPEVITSIEKILLDLNQGGNAITSQDMQLEIAEVVIASAVDESRNRVGRDRDISIHFTFDKKKLSPLSCRPDYFRRVISNIIQNGIEALPAGGTISVACSNADGKLTLEIEDSGLGIADDKVPFIFKRGATFGKSNGSGLGLHFANTCIESWGGQIKYSRSKHGGAKFTIVLPLTDIKARFIAEIPLIGSVAVLDDEIDFYRPWWGENKSDAKLFSTPENFLDWHEDKQNSISACVVDLHLKHAASGADVIRTLGRRSNVYLATSDYLNPEAIEVAETFAVSIVPKSLLYS